MFNYIRRLFMKSLMLSANSDPAGALNLPQGRLAIDCFEATFSPENVVEATKLIIEHGGHHHPFVSQAGIIVYAGNNLGWGLGAGYQTI